MGNKNVVLYAKWNFEQLIILGKINLTINSDESIIIKDSEPELAIIIADTLVGSEFEIGRLTVNTSNINNFIVKINVIIRVFSMNFSKPITFRVIKFFNNQLNKGFVGEEWLFNSIALTKTTFSFFVIDSDFLDDDSCIYKVIATIK